MNYIDIISNFNSTIVDFCISESLSQQEGESSMRMMPTSFTEPCPICNVAYEFPLVVVGPKMCEQCYTDAITWAAKQAFKEKQIMEGNPFYEQKQRS